MDPTERITAYLADELPTDDRLAFEAELARDPALRAVVDGVRRADAELSRLAPTRLPDGAADRLRSVLAAELEAQLGTAGRESAATVTGAGELAERRARRAARWQRPSWTAIGTAAAALLGVAVVGGVIQSGLLTGGDQADVAAEADMDAMSTLEAGPEDLADDAMVDDGPVLLAGDREVTAASAARLLDRPEVVTLVAQELSEEVLRDVGIHYTVRFGADARDLAAARAGDGTVRQDDDEAAPSAEAVFDGPFLRTEGDVATADREAVARCLEVILTGGATVVPAAAELVTYDGEAAIAYALVGLDPTSGTATRSELWIVTRAGCDTRHYSPR